MKEPIWMERAECIAVHEMMLAQDGGLTGVRDAGLLESALAKPRHLFAYGKPRVADLAASYAAGIIRNHPFLDGNKRTGFMVAAIFLEVNGFEFGATEESVVEFTLRLAAGKATEKEYAEWLAGDSRDRSAFLRRRLR